MTVCEAPSFYLTAGESTQVSVGRIKNVVPGLTSATAKGEEENCNLNLQTEGNQRNVPSLKVRAAAAKLRSFLVVYFAG